MPLFIKKECKPHLKKCMSVKKYTEIRKYGALGPSDVIAWDYLNLCIYLWGESTEYKTEKQGGWYKLRADTR